MNVVSELNNRPLSLHVKYLVSQVVNSTKVWCFKKWPPPEKKKKVAPLFIVPCHKNKSWGAVVGVERTVSLTCTTGFSWHSKSVRRLFYSHCWRFCFLLLVWRFWDFCFCFVSLEADEIDSEDSIEPPHKRLCLSSEDDQSIDDSTPCISVVALPRKSLSINIVSFWIKIYIPRG